MIALSKQYTGFKYMLDDESSKEVYIESWFVSGNQTYLRSSWFNEIEEAYMFAPPGYWKSIYNNSLYPDDFPSDVLTSINGGTLTLSINTDVIDGLYTYYLNYNETWFKLNVNIKDNKVININKTNTTCEENINYYYDYNDIVLNLDVWHPHYDDLSTELLVSQIGADNLETDIIVVRHDTSSIKTKILVTHVSDFPIYLNVKGHSELPTDIFVHAKGTLDISTNLTVSVYDNSILPIAFTVKRYDKNILPTNILVCHVSDLYTDLVVKRYDTSNLDTYINIQRVQESYLPISFVVKRYGENVPYIVTELIVKHSNNINSIPTDILVSQSKQLDIPTYIEIINNIEYSDIVTTLLISNKESQELLTQLYVDIPITVLENDVYLTPSRTINSSEILTNINVIKYDNNSIDIDIYVNNSNVFETINNVQLKTFNDLPITLNVQKNIYNDLPTSLIVNPINSTLESIVSTQYSSYNDLTTQIQVRQKTNNDFPITFIINKNNGFETINDVTYQTFSANNNLTTNIEVIETVNNNLYTYIDVVAKPIVLETTNIEFKQLGKNSITTQIIVKQNTVNDLDVYINVIAKSTELNVVSDFIYSDNTNIVTELYVCHKLQDELPTTMMVNPLISFENIINDYNYLYNDLPTTVILTTSSDLVTNIYVSNEKTAPLLFNRAINALPIIKTIKLTAKKDSYNYNYTPLTNYGKYKYMNVGYTKKGDIINSIIGFDYSELDVDLHGASIYYDYQVVQKATLYLYKVASIDSTDVVTVYSATNQWTETSVNYKIANKYKLTKLAEVPTTIKNGWVTIDITDDLQNFEELDTLQRSYVLKLENKQKDNKLITLSTINNTEELAPYVEVTYYHTLDNCNWLDTETLLDIKPYSDLPTILEVPNPTVEDFPIELEVAKHEVSDLSFKLMIEVITSIKFNDLPTTLDIISYPCDEKGIDITLYIKGKGQSDNLETLIIVIKDTSDAYVYIY